MDVESRSARIVPSGQIYRQMFDAQLQLSRSLSQYDSESRIQKLKSRELSQANTFPIIRLEKEDTQHGILNSRQKSWVGGFPNDPYTENPVLFKQYKEYITKKMEDSESSVAGKEVQGLPDIVVSKKPGSDIISRIAESRKQRHESAVEDMHQDLSVISTEMEPRIEALSTRLINRLFENDVVIANILKRIETDEDLLVYQLSDLFDLWSEVQVHTPKRQSWISEMDEGLKQIENERMDNIKEVFNFYGKQFHKIAHLMPSDLQRFLDKETQMINQTVLSNRRSYADLSVRLLSADIEREKTQRTKWKRRVEDWKSLHTKLAIESFSKFMQTEAVILPPGVENVKETLLIDQNTINAKRLELVKTLCDMRPPNSTKSSVYKWRQDMEKLTEELDNATQLHANRLREEYEKVCQTCLDQVESVKRSLIDTGMCSPHRANSVVDEFLLPLVGEQQRVFESKLEEMERATEIHNKLMEEILTRLMKFAQGVAHIWDTHEIGLAKQERALVEKLEQCRQKHDHSNQEKEANLDIVMDRMRQDASEMALKDSLLKALSMLDNIRQSYEEFHEQQTGIVQFYPDMVQDELDSYDDKVCTFFSVSRQPIRPTDENYTEEIAKSGQETVTTDRGNEFFVSSSKETRPESNAGDQSNKEDEADGVSDAAFFTEVEGQAEEELDEDQMPDYIQSINIPNQLIVEVKKVIRFNFLNHLDLWCEQAIDRASSVVAAKTEELNSELDLRLHLHKPRPRRAELDIHNVRAAELVMHAERVTRHCNGMERSLAELGQRFKAMSHEHNKLANAFRMDIEALEVIFVNATKSARLVKLQNQVSIELDKFMSVIRASLRQFRQHLDETLQMLRESNARFIKSFKVFSDGGNFCPEEIDDYRKKLEKMSAMIDTTEGSIMSDLEGMESKRLDNATKISVEFEDRFKSHMSDLVFMERVARWLTNTQVKIKSEVANSNTQAQRLEHLLNDLERRVDACEKPNLDKEQITASQLNDTLLDIFQAFCARSEYLNCAKVPSQGYSGPQTGAPGTTRRISLQRTSSMMSKVGFSADGTLSKAGKPGSEDPSVNVIKSILNKTPSASKDRTQRSKMRFGVDAELDGDFGYGLGTSAGMDSAREKTKSAMSQASSKASETSKGTRKTGSIAGDGGPRRVPSGTRRTSKMSKFDKKYMVFGEKNEEEEEQEPKHFLSVIQKTLKEALDGLLTTAEVFYRQKGARTVTRPQALQETFEQCADIITQKMQSYYQQADEYHNQCLQEYRAQLSGLERLIAHVPALVIADLLKQEVQRSVDAQSSLIDDFQSTLDQLASRQKSNQNELRPTLGHPNQANVLTQVCSLEKERHQDYTDAVAKHTVHRQECALAQSKEFLEKLIRTAEAQLLQYDNMLVIDEMEKGRVDPKRYPTSELIRRQKAGEPLEDDEDKDALPRGKANWIGVPSNQFVLEGRPSKLQVTPSVPTRKTTLAHSATVKARDKAYEDYKEQFEHTLQQVQAEKERLMLLEKRWVDSWDTSVEKVKYLYQK